MTCIGINLDYTMSIPLPILKPLAADFDGDTLNTNIIYNKDFADITNEVLNPVQMYISRNDGLANIDFIPGRDMLINTNSFKSINRYSLEEINQIENCMSMD